MSRIFSREGLRYLAEFISTSAIMFSPNGAVKLDGSALCPKCNIANTPEIGENVWKEWPHVSV